MRPRNALILIAVLAAAPVAAGRILPASMFELKLAIPIGAGACIAAAALSLNILTGYAGQISLGHGAFLTIGAFASGFVTAKGPELPLLAGLVFAAVVGGAFAAVLGLPALRLRGLYLAIATVAFAFSMQESLFQWGPLTGGSGGMSLDRRVLWWDLERTSDYLAFVLGMLVLFALLDHNVVRTKLGRALNAVRWDESVAQSYGVDVTRYKLTAFVLAGSLGSVAGAMYGHLLEFVNGSIFDFDDSLLLVIVVVVGGLGSRAGVIAAGVTFGVFGALPKVVESLAFLSGWDLILGPIAVIDVLTRHPGGFAQAIRDKREKKAVKAARAAGSDEGDDVTMPKLPALPRPSGLPQRPDLAHGAPMLEVSGISVRFGGLQALDDVSLTVPKGQIVGLIGPNGAGKTTLFNVISGLVRPQAGSVAFLGRPLDALPPHARSRLGLGRTFQLIGLVKDRSVLENFLLAQHTVAPYGTPAALWFTPGAARVERELTERARAAIAALGFERFTDTEVRHLSHGQQRLVELGCALVTAPELLLLDEPSAGMSPAAVENLAERLRDIRDELGRTVLLIEHNIPLVLDVCDELNVLNFGKVLATGTTDEIARHPEVVGAYFGEAVLA